jgi:hypothetical protein
LWIVLSKLVHLIFVPTFTVMSGGLIRRFWYFTSTVLPAAGAGAAGAAVVLADGVEPLVETDEPDEPQPAANATTAHATSAVRALFMTGHGRHCHKPRTNSTAGRRVLVSVHTRPYTAAFLWPAIS